MCALIAWSRGSQCDGDGDLIVITVEVDASLGGGQNQVVGMDVYRSLIEKWPLVQSKTGGQKSFPIGLICVLRHTCPVSQYPVVPPSKTTKDRPQ